MSKMHYGFLDESGILEKKAKEGIYFVISVVVVANPVEIRDVLKVARKKVPGKFRERGIFKARHAHPALVKSILRELAERKVEVIVGVWDKRSKKKRIDKNKLYGELVAQVVEMAFTLYPRLDITIHKRYTDPKFQNQLHDTIVQKIKNHSGVMVLNQQDERQRKELELADAVAYAVFQKYNRGKNEFYEIIRKKIKVESRLAA